MPIGAAIGAGIGAVGSIGAAAIGANAQTKAAQAAIAAQQNALQQGYAWAGNEQNLAAGVLNPFISQGQNALTQYEAALPGLTKPFDASQLATTPGYQFDLQQGLKGVQNSYAAEGLGSSGSALKGAAQFATGTAQSTYNQQFQNYLTQNAQIGNLLFQPASLGAGAAGSLASIYGGLGGAGLQGAVQTGQGIAGSITGAGNAIAGAATGAANALTGGVNSALQYSLLSQLLSNNNGGANPAAAGAYNPYLSGALATNGPTTLGTANSYLTQ